MQLFNTLGRKVEELVPQDPPTVTFYSCGPTVYDYPHIGNWYTFIRYDELVRSLRAAGFDVDWVMNITDVGHLTSDADEGEDKLEKGAKREGLTAWDVAKKYTDNFALGMKKLNINQPSKLPKATDHIKEQIALVKTLESKGHTYVIDDGVYFDTSTFKDYGKMAQLDLEHLKEGARVEINPQKKHASDFALWKFSPNPPAGGQHRDMEWDSPWGKGFPGWHLECSAMSMKYLGETLDIHGGGIDHIPVHHTNEIAQSEAATGKPFSKFWFHSYFNLVDGKKMSKSLGNFYTLEDIEKHGIEVLAFRLLVLQSHYRTEAHFSWENLEAAQNRLKNWHNAAALRYQVLHKGDEDTAETLVMARSNILKALEDDLNTPLALSNIEDAFSVVENGLPAGSEEAYIKLLTYIDDVLGLDLSKQDDISDKQKLLLEKRQKARDEKDWTLADKLRNELQEESIVIRDTDNGQFWSRL